MLLVQKIDNHRLILASQSPRRQELLRDAGLPFTLAPRYEVDEERYDTSLSRYEVPMVLAERKSIHYPQALEPQDVLLTADTLVWCKGGFLGKPKGEAHARTMLQTLSGAVHEVITGVCLRSPSRQHCFYAVTQVHFRGLKPEEIEYYIAHYQPFDKAGAYGIQEWIGYVGVERIEGSYYNVMGLPMQTLYVELERFLAP